MAKARSGASASRNSSASQPDLFDKFETSDLDGTPERDDALDHQSAASDAALLSAPEPIFPRWLRTVDGPSILAVFLLMSVGLLLGFAASVPLAVGNGLPPYYYVSRQVVFAVASLFGILLLSMQSPATIRRLGLLGFLFFVLALSALPWLGTDFGKGATRWYSLGFISVQPSEFLKPCFVIFAAWLLAGAAEENGPHGTLISLVVLAGVVGLLVEQPDFGQAALLGVSWGMMYFVAGAPWLVIIALASISIVGGVAAYNLSAHFAGRIDGYLASEVDPRAQLGYATNAIREGGIFGVGVGEGSVKNTLPDAHTDFIIAVAAEEYGLIVVFLIIALFLFICVRALWRLLDERDCFIRLAATGLVSLIGLQSFVNIGVAVRLLPAKGMTLPFISYGGSSMLAAGLTLGFLLALTRKRPQGDVRDAFAR